MRGDRTRRQQNGLFSWRDTSAIVRYLYFIPYWQKVHRSEEVKPHGPLRGDSHHQSHMTPSTSFFLTHRHYFSALFNCPHSSTRLIPLKGVAAYPLQQGTRMAPHYDAWCRDCPTVPASVRSDPHTIRDYLPCATLLPTGPSLLPAQTLTLPDWDNGTPRREKSGIIANVWIKNNQDIKCTAGCRQVNNF